MNEITRTETRKKTTTKKLQARNIASSPDIREISPNISHKAMNQ